MIDGVGIWRVDLDVRRYMIQGLPLYHGVVYLGALELRTNFRLNDDLIIIHHCGVLARFRYEPDGRESAPAAA